MSVHSQADRHLSLQREKDIWSLRQQRILSLNRKGFILAARFTFLCYNIDSSKSQAAAAGVALLAHLPSVCRTLDSSLETKETNQKPAPPQ